MHRSLLILLSCTVLHAAEVRIPVTRDTFVAAVPSQEDGNNGRSTRLKTKGAQEMSIFDIDPAPLRGKVITSATLHMNCASPDAPQKRVTISTLATNWAEGKSSGYGREPGSANFLWARAGQVPWAFSGSDLTAAALGEGNTIWAFADATPPDRDGWQIAGILPDVVAARVAGLSFGFVLMDDVGSEYTRDGERFTYHSLPNRYIFSREQNSRAPYLIVQTGAEDTRPPRAIEKITQLSDRLPDGEAVLTWAAPEDEGSAGTLGFVARFAEEPLAWDRARPIPQYLVPLAGPKTISMHLRDLGLKAGQAIVIGIRPVDRAGNIGPVTTCRVTLPQPLAPVALPEPPARGGKPAELPIIAGYRVSIIDALDKVQPETGQMIPPHVPDYLRSNHLWSAADKTIHLRAARNEFIEFQILLQADNADVRAEISDLKFEISDLGVRADFSRYHPVQSKLGPLPDPLVPIDTKVDAPTKFTSILAEIYIPHEAAHGQKTGTLTIEIGGQSLSLAVDLTVWNFTLPDHLSFIPEMNCYGLPRESEREYYRLAHQHRTCLNRLGYSWRGTISDNCAPRWDGTGFDWSEYDRRFGPLLDGSAFADLPRRGVPVDSFYLPLNENWPVPIDPHFRGGYWAEDALDAEYRARFIEACAQFVRHVSEKRWNDTFFEFYLNNKVYYKKDSWSRSSAPWILDEPANTQDFWALRWYGMAFHEGVTPNRSDAKMAFRCDISRPQWQRNILDGILDVNVVGGDLRRYQRAVVDRKLANREVLFNYGSSNPIESSNTQPAAWCIEAWCLGADGVLPWQTVGTDRSWTAADELSLFYPGKRIGRAEPVPSIRLKAYRRGQQDVEYLTLLGQTSGHPRWSIAQLARRALNLSPQVEQRSAEDAGLVSFKDLSPESLHALRVRVGQYLDAARPPAKRRLVELRTPPRDVASIRPIPVVR